MFKLAYKIGINGKAIQGCFLEVPSDYTEYEEGAEPIELIEARKVLTSEEINVKFVTITDKHIQAEVQKYNDANGVMFGSIHNCSTYVTVNTYSHQAFCIAIIEWNALVWETVRAFQATATTIPTEAEFQAVLDSVPFNG